MTYRNWQGESLSRDPFAPRQAYCEGAVPGLVPVPPLAGPPEPAAPGVPEPELAPVAPPAAPPPPPAVGFAVGLAELPVLPEAPIPELPALRFCVVVSVVGVVLVLRVVDWHPTARTARDRLSRMRGRVVILRGITISS
jgi:hypothetical protein